MRRVTLLLVVLCAVLSFGGSFECRGSNHGDHDDDDRVRASSQN